MTKKQILGFVVVVLGLLVTFFNSKLGSDSGVANDSDSTRVDSLPVDTVVVDSISVDSL